MRPTMFAAALELLDIHGADDIKAPEMEAYAELIGWGRSQTYWAAEFLLLCQGKQCDPQVLVPVHELAKLMGGTTKYEGFLSDVELHLLCFRCPPEGQDPDTLGSGLPLAPPASQRPAQAGAGMQAAEPPRPVPQTRVPGKSQRQWWQRGAAEGQTCHPPSIGVPTGARPSHSGW